ncbi:protein of unknown function [Aquimarina amphilecti]|uniref:DUF2024 domain-containing protein n=1 Tax=Aquimarina amphilecti TaxID=1038014 RepID=A0A1H7QSX4_AQUAM|nr:DUF2024 family protein [Aquimarina amphilecti]SEL50397.1 protein of unknown function [Aquimarina amphilecti]
MKVSVWDTYVNRSDGKIMHFDILVPSNFNNEDKIFDFGKNYLKTKEFITKELTAKECNFCHIDVAPDIVVQEITEKGYSIIEIENCN